MFVITVTTISFILSIIIFILTKEKNPSPPTEPSDLPFQPQFPPLQLNCDELYSTALNYDELNSTAISSTAVHC